MPYPNSFIRSTAIFALPDGEVANTSISWNPSSPIVSLDDATISHFVGIWNVLWANIKPYYAAATGFIGGRTSWIGTDGHTLAAGDFPLPFVAGTGGGQPLPNEVAHVVSLKTGLSSRRTRGRSYLPAMSTVQMTADARINNTTCQSVADFFAAMLADQTVGSETYSSVVASATGSLMTEILTVAVGNVPDSQRRRRDSQPELYFSSPV